MTLAKISFYCILEIRKVDSLIVNSNESSENTNINVKRTPQNTVTSKRL